MVEILRRWWSKKYNLPRNHDLLQRMTFAELFEEYLEDKTEELASLKARMDTADSIDQPMRDRVRALEELLGLPISETRDPMIAKWEEEFARGETPDLSEGWHD